MIQAVYFDVGGTLIEPYPSVGEVYAKAARIHGLKASPTELEDSFARAWSKHIAASTRGAWRAVVEDVLEECAFEGDRDACFSALYDAFTKREAWRIFDDVEETLDALDVRRVRMGVLSNWDERLRPLLTTLDLARRFEWTVVSAEVQREKPEPAIFHIAVERAGIARERILYVGDNVDLDLKGALGAGLPALLIDRSGRSDHPRAIRRLTELLRFLE
jgi:putative hydrolase of the HAD superfamily